MQFTIKMTNREEDGDDIYIPNSTVLETAAGFLADAVQKKAVDHVASKVIETTLLEQVIVKGAFQKMVEEAAGSAAYIPGETVQQGLERIVAYSASKMASKGSEVITTKVAETTAAKAAEVVAAKAGEITATKIAETTMAKTAEVVTTRVGDFAATKFGIVAGEAVGEIVANKVAETSAAKVAGNVAETVAARAVSRAVKNNVENTVATLVGGVVDGVEDQVGMAVARGAAEAGEVGGANLVKVATTEAGKKAGKIFGGFIDAGLIFRDLYRGKPKAALARTVGTVLSKGSLILIGTSMGPVGLFFVAVGMSTVGSIGTELIVGKDK